MDLSKRSASLSRFLQKSRMVDKMSWKSCKSFSRWHYVTHDRSAERTCLPVKVFCFNSQKKSTKELNKYMFTFFLIGMENIGIVTKLVILSVIMTERKQSVNKLYVSNMTLVSCEKLENG
jgi:hypothetical protein